MNNKELKLKRKDSFSGYSVSDEGEVYSNKSGKLKHLKSFIDNLGYKQVILFNDDGKRVYFRVHRLVAICWIENDDPDLTIVNHKDGNKLNNHVDNLEWSNISRNTKHGYDNGLYRSKSKCAILITCKSTNKRKIFLSIRECSKTLGINRKTISSILKGEKLTNNYPYDFEYV